MANKQDKFLSYQTKTSSPLEISLNKNAVSSDFSHGSFSGADITVYAHYHTNPAKIKLLSKRKDTLISELDSVFEDMASADEDKNVADYIIGTYEERRQYLESEIEKVEKDIDKSSSSIIKPFGTMHTLSYSIHREKGPARTLGRVYAKEYTRGQRTIAGTMIFISINRHVFYEFLELNQGQYNTGTTDQDRFRITTALTDQLQPIDFSLVFSNEYGATSYMGLYGVEFVQEGSTFSIEDIYSENVMQYIARDIDLMRPIGQRNLNPNVETEWSNTASNLSDIYEKLNTRKRRNPFI